MIALGIFTTWLTLTAAGFAGLSALRRAGAREDADAGLAPVGRQTPAFIDAHISIPRTLLQ
ncbi:MAG TPA: hypothetical protein VNY31_10250 [Solirubrobacteraceae bacterium]|jgi:hypothetical protein|nr:hypothetical protein [Solirubrobacteraceae bacterium]